MEPCRFSEAKPVIIFNFQSTLKHMLDSDQIPYMAAHENMGNFMYHDAHKLYCFMMKDNEIELGSFRPWLDAVQFML